MKIIIASDHAGFRYKTLLLEELRGNGYECLDLGAWNEEPSDYPDHAANVANAIQHKEGEKAILICGSGVGVSVVANKFMGIRAGVCHDTYSAHQCVEHDNVNVLCLGQRVIGFELAREIVDVFLRAQFNDLPRYRKRLGKVLAIERRNLKEESA